MDTYSVAIIELTAGSSGSIDYINVNGVNILSTSVPFVSDLPTLAAYCVSDINANSNNIILSYTAYNYVVDNNKMIYSRRELGTQTVGYPVQVDNGHGITSVNSNFFNNSQQETITNTGWITQISGSYSVLEVVDANNFLINFRAAYSYTPVTDSGSIFSTANYVFFQV